LVDQFNFTFIFWAPPRGCIASPPTYPIYSIEVRLFSGPPFGSRPDKKCSGPTSFVVALTILGAKFPHLNTTQIRIKYKRLYTYYT